MKRPVQETAPFTKNEQLNGDTERCPKCGDAFREGDWPWCPHGHIGGYGFTLKGAGFHKNDYPKGK